MNLVEWVIGHKAWLMLVGLPFFLLAGRLWPYASPPAAGSPWPRWGRNLGLAGLNGGLSFLLVVPITVWAASHAAAWRPAGWQGAAGLALDVLLLDAWLYLWHRANHAVPLLWRLHEIHHLDTRLDASTALRFHAGEVLLGSLLRAGVIVLLAMPLASVLLFESLVLVAALFHHSNLRLPPRLERALARVIVTPSIHWVHHHAVRADTDSNYATLLSVWDRLLGSQSLTRKTPDMQIGVEGKTDAPLWRLLWQPFHSGHRC